MSSGGINPAFLKFIVALVIATGAISLLSTVSKTAAVTLALVIVLLLFVKDSPLPYWLNRASATISTGIA